MKKKYPGRKARKAVSTMDPSTQELAAPSSCEEQDPAVALQRSNNLHHQDYSEKIWSVLSPEGPASQHSQHLGPK